MERGRQFEEPWHKRASTAELQSEHEYSYGRLVRSHQYMSHPADKPWPRYEGHGSSVYAHEGIFANGHRHEVGQIEGELQRRGVPLPEHHLGNLQHAIDTFPFSGTRWR